MAKRKPRRQAVISTSVRFTPELDAAVRAAAAERKVSVTGLISEIIEEWMLFRRPPRPEPSSKDVHAVNTVGREQ